MTQQERDWLHWLKMVRDGKLTQKQAAQRMGVTARWVRVLVQRMKRKGDRVVVHGLRGQPSNRKIPEARRAKVVGILQGEPWRGYGPTLAAEELAAEYGMVVGKETLRGWMMEAKLWKPRRAQVERVHVWRRRRECCGELVQWDTSEHDWLEGRGERLYLIAMLDDATSRALARFVRHDSTAENMRLLWTYLERWGRPLEFYTDKASLFHVNPRLHYNKHLEERPALTQIGRALQGLDIGWIAAHSPQAKGRIERFFGTAQDRLVKGLRKVGAGTLEQANRYLEQVYLPLWNRRFIQPPANPSDAHRPLGRQHDLAAILSRVEQRVVTNDYTLRFDGAIYQILREQVRPGLRGATVRVEQRLDGTLAVRFRDRYVHVQLCQPVAEAARVAPSGRSGATRSRRGGSDWMRDFDLQNSPPLWQLLERSTGPPEAS